MPPEYNVNRSIRARVAAKHGAEGGTIKQASARTHALDSLVLAIEVFRAEQENTMPATYAALTDDELHPDTKVAMTVSLHMPSSPPNGDASLVSAAERSIEVKIRCGGMTDELNRLLHHLRLKGCFHRDRIANVTGQQAATRAQTTQATVNANIQKAKDAYRRHYTAHLALVGEGRWQETMRRLDDSDCRPLGGRLIEKMEKMGERKIKQFLDGNIEAGADGQTKYKLPWIWYSWGGKTGDEITDGEQS